MTTSIHPVEKSDILCIINPNAGRKNVHQVIDELNSLYPEIRHVVTHDITEVDRVMQSEIHRYKVFVAVGGDGTASAVGKHLVDTGKALAVLPFGSGNGFARELGFTASVQKILQDIQRGEVLEIDVLHINKAPFINMAGIGFDAEVAHRLKRISNSGIFNYVWTAIRAYGSYLPVDIIITGPGIHVQGKYFMVSIANTRQFGNNAILSPLSRPDDGQFEIICVSPLSFLHLLSNAGRLFKKGLVPSKHISFFSCTETLHIRTSAKKMHLDGEPLAGDGNYEIGIWEKSLRVVKVSR